MPFATAHSFHPAAATALAECVGQLLEAHGPHPDLLVVLATHEHAESWPEIGRAAQALLRPGCQVGARSASLIAGPRVALHQPGLSLWAAWGLDVAGAVTLRPLSQTPARPQRFEIDTDIHTDIRNDIHADDHDADHSDHHGPSRRVDGADADADAGGGDGDDRTGDDGGGDPWAHAGGGALDDLVTACGPTASLLVWASAGAGVEALVAQLSWRHRDLPCTGAVLPATHATGSRSRPSIDGGGAMTSSALQLDGADITEAVLVVVLGRPDLPVLPEVRARATASMEVVISSTGWPPPISPGTPPTEAPSEPPDPADPAMDTRTDTVTGDLVLDILQRRAQAALVFDSGWAGDLGADLTELDLPLVGLNGVRVIGPVVSPGFIRPSTRPARPEAPAMPVVPAIAVALFRDRSDPT